jgi:hypothetical protein
LIELKRRPWEPSGIWRKKKKKKIEDDEEILLIVFFLFGVGCKSVAAGWRSWEKGTRESSDEGAIWGH